MAILIFGLVVLGLVGLLAIYFLWHAIRTPGEPTYWIFGGALAVLFVLGGFALRNLFEPPMPFPGP